MSQGFLDYSHASQSLSSFTSSNIKTSSFDPSLNICDDELTNIYPPLSLRIWYLLIHYKNGEIRLENRVT